MISPRHQHQARDNDAVASYIRNRYKTSQKRTATTQGRARGNVGLALLHHDDSEERRKSMMDNFSPRPAPEHDRIELMK